MSLADLYFSATLFMYLVFLLRLNMVYKSSSYAYKTKYLIIAAAIIIIIILTANIIHPLTFHATPFVYNEIGLVYHISFNTFVMSSVLILDFSHHLDSLQRLCIH
eukprot:97586_1